MSIHLYADNHIIGIAESGIFREDLQRAGIGQGKHGFISGELPLALQAELRVGTRIHAFYDPERAHELPNSPLVLQREDLGQGAFNTYRLHPEVIAFFLPDSLRKAQVKTMAEIKQKLPPAIAHQMEYNLRNIERGEHILRQVETRIGQAKGRSILDVGCGIGGILVAFGLAGYELYGIELDSQRVRLCRKNLEFNQLDAVISGVDLCKQTMSETFDVIICNSVIEHVSDPERMLERMGKMLRPGGVLVLGVANKDALGNIIADPHYGLFGLTAMPHPAAGEMYRLLADRKQSYSVTEFYGIHWYANQLRRSVGSVDAVFAEPPRDWDALPGLFARVTQGFAECLGKQGWQSNPILRREFNLRFSRYIGEAWKAYMDALESGEREGFRRRYLEKSYHLYTVKDGKPS